MTEPKPRLVQLGSFGKSVCYLVYVGEEEIGRVIGKAINTKHTQWSALGLHYFADPSGKVFFADFTKRKEAVDALFADWKERHQ